MAIKAMASKLAQLSQPPPPPTTLCDAGEQLEIIILTSIIIMMIQKCNKDKNNKLPACSLIAKTFKVERHKWGEREKRTEKRSKQLLWCKAFKTETIDVLPTHHPQQQTTTTTTTTTTIANQCTRLSAIPGRSNNAADNSGNNQIGNGGQEKQKKKEKKKGKANCQPSSSLERRRRSPNEIKRAYFLLLHKCKKKNSCKAFSTISNTSLQNVISLPPQYHCWSPSADNPLPKMLTNLLAKSAKPFPPTFFANKQQQ